MSIAYKELKTSDGTKILSFLEHIPELIVNDIDPNESKIKKGEAIQITFIGKINKSAVVECLRIIAATLDKP